MKQPDQLEEHFFLYKIQVLMFYQRLASTTCRSSIKLVLSVFLWPPQVLLTAVFLIGTIIIAELGMLTAGVS